MFSFAGPGIFGFDADADLHRSLMDEVDRRFEDDDLAQFDGEHEVEGIHARGDGDFAAMSARDDGGGDVDPFHDATPEDGA